MIKNDRATMAIELQMRALARCKRRVPNAEPENPAALSVEAAAMARMPRAGTDWIPGKTTYEAGRIALQTASAELPTTGR